MDRRSMSTVRSSRGFISVLLSINSIKEIFQRRRLVPIARCRLSMGNLVFFLFIFFFFSRICNKRQPYGLRRESAMSHSKLKIVRAAKNSTITLQDFVLCEKSDTSQWKFSKFLLSSLASSKAHLFT